MFNEDDWIPISALAHYDFCPRRVVLINAENIWNDNRWTVEGKILHEKTDQENRKTAHGVRFVRSLRISSAEVGLYGVADVVEFRQTDSDEFAANRAEFNSAGISLPVCAGLWFPVPIEFKRGKTRSAESYEIQLCAQGLCLEEKYSLSIPHGYIYFGQSGHRSKIVFSDALRQKLVQWQMMYEKYLPLILRQRQSSPKNVDNALLLTSVCQKHQNQVLSRDIFRETLQILNNRRCLLYEKTCKYTLCIY